MDDIDKNGGAETRDREAQCIISLDAVRRKRADVRSEGTAPTSADMPGIPDLTTIAREPFYAERRRKLADAMAFFSGAEPDARLLDHQMIVTGLAAGHGCEDGEGGRPLGSAMDDPAVVVGLVLHYARHNGRSGLPMPRSVLSQLDRHVAMGSAAARLVRDWLNARSVPCDKRRLWVHDGGKA
jgi:hypothetical protein